MNGDNAGPDRITRLMVSPHAITLPAGDSTRFQAMGQTAGGTMEPVAVSWSASGGTISEAGIYTARADSGAFSVIATEQTGALADTATVVISPSLAHIVLVPDSTTLAVGAVAQFTAYGRLQSGDSVSVSVSYAATGGTITPAGVYTAGQVAGTFQVIATEQSGTLADTSTVTITPTLQHVVLVPAAVTLPSGGTQQFTAFGRVSSGDSVAVSVNYTATGGTITAAGLYTAGQAAGTYQVIATQQSGTLADTSTVTITPTLQHVVLVPATATLQFGATQQFAAYGRMTTGDSVPVSVTYTASGGTITAGGQYTAGRTAGTFEVIATQQGGTLADTSPVTIIAPSLTQVVLVPPAAALVVGAAQQFATYGRMSNGDSVAVGVTYTATGGTITAGGLYTAGQVDGTFSVIATVQGGTLADTSIVTITPTLQHVILVPATATVAVGATQQFVVYGRISNGDSVPVSVTYTASGGTITPAGLYTAGQTAGSYQVIATLQGGTLADTSIVTVVPVLRQVVLVPATAKLDVGGTQQFATYGRMSNGDSVAVSVSYSATGGTITSGGLYTAGQAAGTFAVIATEQAGALADTSFVSITPTLQHVVLLPASVTLEVGSAQQFAAYGTMSNGDSVAVNVTYAATGGAITSGGLYTAGATAGTFRVIATLAGGTLADTSQIIIAAPTLSQIVIEPKSVVLNEGAPQQFGAYGHMSNGDSVAVSVTYSATGGTITTGGLYTAGQSPGTFRVIAAGPGGTLADTASVTINGPPPLAQVIVVPSSDTLVEGATQQFLAYGRNSIGDSVAVAVTWSAKGGTITSSGLYTAGTSTGSFRVIAKQSGDTLADTALVRIVAPALVQVVLVPASASLVEGATQQFAVYGRMNNGDSVAVSASYSATGGTITSGGLYTAGQSAGTFRVIAAGPGGTPADTASVTIVAPPPLAQVIVVPSSDTLVEGATQQFFAYGRNSIGDSVAVAVTWSAKGGTITSSGLYTAGTSTGSFRIIAKQSGGTLADTALVRIVAPALVQVVLVPASASLVEGATQQFAAYGRMNNGDSVAVSASYSATGGTISSGGLYTAGQTTGVFRVIAAAQGLADTASVTIVAPLPLAQVILLPSSDTLVEGSTQQFFAYGRNSAGDSVAIAVSWSAKGGTITSSGLYTAGTSTGSFRVIAKQSGGTLADTTLVRIVAPALAQVVLVPSSASLFEGTTQQFAAYGRMNNGDSVTVSATYSATGGTITAGGSYTAGSTDGVFRVIAVAQGLADTATITIAPPPPLAQLFLVPATASLPAGTTLQFVVYGLTSAGDSVPVAVTWSAKGGTITSSGLYTAGSSTGTFRVIAKQSSGTLADTAKVTITAPSTVQLVIVPSAVTLAVGSTQQFGAYGLTSAGDSVATSVTWSATGGTISSSGKYTAGKTTGTFRVIAKQSSGSLADTAAVTITSSGGGGGTAVLVGAGDIVDCSATDAEATASVLDNISGTVFTAGDNAYPDGSAADYTCYDASWGRHKSRTFPAPGNHEYNTAGAAGYFGYFGSAAGPSGRGYYSYNLGSWHIISLDSEIPMNAGSAQETWLRADLAANTQQCTLAYWHRPRFSSGTNHGSATDVQPLWQALYDYGAEIVINGHEHNYERFAPQTPSGAADPAKGIREFISGTGGKSHYNDEGTPLPNSEVFNGTTFGVLKLTLGSGTYSWQFIPASGGSFTDSGSGSCH